MTAISLKKRLAERRERNRELARIDAANRCPICKRGLDNSLVVVGAGVTRYCSLVCFLEAEDPMTKVGRR